MVDSEEGGGGGDPQVAEANFFPLKGVRNNFVCKITDCRKKPKLFIPAKNASFPGLPDFSYTISKRGKIYQMTT
jgi:hypothetical protein